MKSLQYRTPTRRAIAAIALTLSLAACADEAGRPLGSSCDTPVQCASNLCGGEICLDPAADDDGDGLTNAVEVALGTSPLRVDTDADAVDDRTEVGAIDAPSDRDADGKIDAVDSRVADCDEDGVVDEDDAIDGADARGECHADCGDRTDAVALVVNTTADGSLAIGAHAVHRATVTPGAAYTIRAYQTEMESAPEARVFTSGADLCNHAIVALASGLAAADAKVRPFTSLRTAGNPTDTQPVVIPEGSSTIYLRIDNTAPNISGYQLSVAPEPGG